MIPKFKNTNFTNVKNIFRQIIQILIKFSIGKNDVEYFIGYRDCKKLGLYAYSFQK